MQVVSSLTRIARGTTAVHRIVVTAIIVYHILRITYEEEVKRRRIKRAEGVPEDEI
jgi:hypothetical protein